MIPQALALTTSCTAADLKEINKRKEFTLISTQLLHELFTDPTINDHAIKCWQLLFNKARFNENLEISISYKCISELRGKSKRTIIRYINALEKAGYLEITVKSTSEKGYLPNTIQVRVPSRVVTKVKESKDKSSYLDNGKYSESSTLIEKPTSATNTIQNSRNENKREVSTSLTYKEVQETSSIDALEQEEPLSLATSMSLEPSVTSDTLKNNSNKENKNNVVVFSIPEKETIENFSLEEVKNLEEGIFIRHDLRTILENKDCQKTLKLLEKIESELKLLEELKISKETNNKQPSIKLINNIRTQLQIFQDQKEVLNKYIIENQSIVKKTHLMNSEIQFMLSKPGNNPISSFAFKRLVKILSAYGYSGNDLIYLVNEIIFEVRFGTLIKSNQSGKVLTPNHAINIAIKLVREKRWETPSLLKKMEGLT